MTFAGALAGTLAGAPGVVGSTGAGATNEPAIGNTVATRLAGRMTVDASRAVQNPSKLRADLFAVYFVGSTSTTLLATPPSILLVYNKNLSRSLWGWVLHNPARRTRRNL
jgi:hypothetical protein